jgi:hypothetical protein
VSLRVPLGSMVVHVDEPWGASRSSTFAQILANLTAVALASSAVDERRVDTSNSIEALLAGRTAIASATGMLAEVLGLSVEEAQRALNRLARAHGSSVTAYSQVIVEAHDRDPSADPFWARPPAR